MKRSAKPSQLSLILLDIRSVQNAASLFRTADCAGISKIYLVGTTPSPIDRFGRARGDFSKISLGAEKAVEYEYAPEIHPLLEKLKEEGCEIVAIEQDERSVDYKEYEARDKTALILGNEVEGVSKEVLGKCDAILEIPMMGQKESLNVSVAGAIVLFRILNI